MALKVKATEQLIKIGKYEGKYRYIMMPELYTALAQEKVIKEAAMRSGVNRGRTGHHAIRTARQERREGRRG